MLRAAAELRSQLGRQASQAEVAARCGMSQVRLAYLRKFMPSPIPWCAKDRVGVAATVAGRLCLLSVDCWRFWWHARWCSSHARLWQALR